MINRAHGTRIAEDSFNLNEPELASQWWSRERILALALLAATALTFYLCYLLARPFLSVLAWALALAVIGRPLHRQIARRLRSSNLAAALAVVVIAAAVVAPVIVIGQQIGREAVAGAQTVRTEQERWRLAIERNPRLAPALRWIEQQIILEEATRRVREAIEARASSLVRGSMEMAAELLITFFFLFYFFRDRRTVVRALRSFVPLSSAETDKVFARVSDTIHATVYGTVVVGIAQGALGGLLFWALGLPAPLLWGAVMALLAILPVVGTFLVWLPAAAFLALEGSLGKALILVGGGLVVSLVDNWLYPALMGRRLRLHTVPVFIALVGGLTLFGAAGLVLGPIVLALTVALVEVWRQRTANGQTADVMIEPVISSR